MSFFVCQTAHTRGTLTQHMAVLLRASQRDMNNNVETCTSSVVWYFTPANICLCAFFARHNLANLTDNDAMCCIWRSLRHKGSMLKGGSKKSTRNRCRAKARESALVYLLLCIGFGFILTRCRPAFRGRYAVPVDLSLGGDYTLATAY